MHGLLNQLGPNDNASRADEKPSEEAQTSHGIGETSRAVQHDFLIDAGGCVWSAGATDDNLPARTLRLAGGGIVNPLVSKCGFVHLHDGEGILFVAFAPRLAEMPAIAAAAGLMEKLQRRLNVVVIANGAGRWELFKGYAAALCWIELILALHRKIVLPPEQTAKLLRSIESLQVRRPLVGTFMSARKPRLPVVSVRPDL